MTRITRIGLLLSLALIGASLANVASASAANNLRLASQSGAISLNADQYPAALSNGTSSTTTITLQPEYSITCTESSLHGTLQGPMHGYFQTLEKLHLTAAYAGCTSTANGEGSYPTTVSMHNCDWDLYLWASAPYRGFWGLACENAGETVEILTKTQKGGLLCTTKISPQLIYESTSPVAMSNVFNEASTEGVELGLPASDRLDYTLVGKYCAAGEYTDEGAIEMATSLWAT